MFTEPESPLVSLVAGLHRPECRWCRPRGTLMPACGVTALRPVVTNAQARASTPAQRKTPTGLEFCVSRCSAPPQVTIFACARHRCSLNAPVAGVACGKALGTAADSSSVGRWRSPLARPPPLLRLRLLGLMVRSVQFSSDRCVREVFAAVFHMVGEGAIALGNRRASSWHGAGKGLGVLRRARCCPGTYAPEPKVDSGENAHRRHVPAGADRQRAVVLTSLHNDNPTEAAGQAIGQRTAEKARGVGQAIGHC